jgi:hypothetical protein
MGRSLFVLQRTWNPYELSPPDCAEGGGAESESKTEMNLLRTLNMMSASQKGYTKEESLLLDLVQDRTACAKFKVGF